MGSLRIGLIGRTAIDALDSWLAVNVLQLSRERAPSHDWCVAGLRRAFVAAAAAGLREAGLGEAGLGEAGLGQRGAVQRLVVANHDQGFVVDGGAGLCRRVPSTEVGDRVLSASEKRPDQGRRGGGRSHQGRAGGRDKRARRLGEFEDRTVRLPVADGTVCAQARLGREAEVGVHPAEGGGEGVAQWAEAGRRVDGVAEAGLAVEYGAQPEIFARGRTDTRATGICTVNGRLVGMPMEVALHDMMMLASL